MHCKSTTPFIGACTLKRGAVQAYIQNALVLEPDWPINVYKCTQKCCSYNIKNCVGHSMILRKGPGLCGTKSVDSQLESSQSPSVALDLTSSQERLKTLLPKSHLAMSMNDRRGARLNEADRFNSTRDLRTPSFFPSQRNDRTMK